MKKKALGITALVLVILCLLARVCISLMIHLTSDWGVWLGLYFATFWVAVICLVGCVLGWCSFKTRTGRVAAIMGTLLVLFFFYQFFQTFKFRAPTAPIPTTTSVQSVIAR